LGKACRERDRQPSRRIDLASQYLGDGLPACLAGIQA
jgi:hypothetical protein